uniref:hypothetical protein n=1 Tax=Aeromonas veronii TaxID=654 RepID=UPI003D1E3D2E
YPSGGHGRRGLQSTLSFLDGKSLEPQNGRTGRAAHRVVRMVENKVDKDVIALQLTKNSEKNNPKDPETFTGQDIDSIVKFHKANQSSVAIDLDQTASLIKQQKALDADAGNADFVTTFGDDPEPQLP